MTARHFLAIVAIVQGALLAALLVLIVLNRWFRLRRSSRLNPRREAVDASMRRWAAGTAPLAGVLVGLARLPTPLAIDALVKWSARVPGERWRQLAQALEHTWWARLVRTNSMSARWWKRLESARFLSVAAMPRDVARLTRLINDRHPAVHVAAVACLERMENTALTLTALDRLPQLAPTVQAYYAAMLLRSRPVVVEHLQKRLRRQAQDHLGHRAGRRVPSNLRFEQRVAARRGEAHQREGGAQPHPPHVVEQRRLQQRQRTNVGDHAERPYGLRPRRPRIVFGQPLERGNGLAVREAAKRACRLHADFGIGVIGQCRQAFAQRRLTQPRRKLGEAGQGRIVSAAQALLQVLDHHRP